VLSMGVLTLGTAFSVERGRLLFMGIFLLRSIRWPHFLLLSFYIFVVITLGAVVYSLLDRRKVLAAMVVVFCVAGSAGQVVVGGIDCGDDRVVYIV